MKTTSKKQSTKDVPVEEVPEVLRYMEAEDNLRAFIQKNQPLMDELSVLVEERNESLQNADGAVRALCNQHKVGINCGPLRFKHFSERVNAELMFDTLGADEFMQLRGEIKTVQQYVADKDYTIRAIKNGQIDSDVAANFYQLTPNYHKIPVVVLP